MPNPAVPTALKLLRGNPGKRPINKDEPQPEIDLATPPEWMSATQKALWTRVIAESPKNLLKSLDESVLSAWVLSYDLYRQASISVEKDGLLVKSPNGHEIQNPNLPIMNRQALIMLKAAAEMGFTPSSRTRIKVGKEIKTPGSKFDKYA